MKHLRIVLTIIGVFSIVTAITSSNFVVKASEGEIEMVNTAKDKYRCYALSVLLESVGYRVLITCRDLIYPPQSEFLSYIVWAKPLDGGTPKRLGKLGVGKAEFRTQQSFASLFVTIEKGDGTNSRTPSGQTVMSGDIKAIDFLTKPPSPTPTVNPDNNTEEEISTDEGKTTPDSTVSTKDKILLGLKRAGLVSIIAIIAIMGLVFVITRSKG